MAYVYRHIRLDKNEPFYIGIGSDKYHYRAYDKERRNHIWKKIVAKTEYEVEILFDNIERIEACKKEIEFINLYGKKYNNTGTLSNLTDGGDGSIGIRTRKGAKLTNVTKNKMSLARSNYYKNGGITTTTPRYGNNYKGKLTLDTYTGIYYENIKQAANSIGIKPSMLEWKIKNQKQRRFCLV
jgi:hypothetical protein